MNLASLAEYLVAFLLLAGGFFALVGAIGLTRLSSFDRRLHGPTKASTLGVGGILLASMLFHLIDTGGISLRDLLITLFLFITAPISALMMMRAHLAHRSDRPRPPEL
jgi:multicomponent K+:H+ antiporter subunit G